MAEQCANCGRSDLLQPDIANLQCLGCSALTSIATGQVVVAKAPVENLSNAGFPVVELSTGVIEAEANEYQTPVSDPGPAPEPEAPAPEPEPRPARVDEGYIPAEASQSAPEAPVTPAEVVDEVTDPASMVVDQSVMGPSDIDLSALSPEQIAAVEAIVHQGG